MATITVRLDCIMVGVVLGMNSARFRSAIWY